MELKFKLGDKVKRINRINSGIPIGFVGIIGQSRHNLSGEPGYCFQGSDVWNDECNLELVESNGKVIIPDKHVIVQDSCGNFVAFNNSYKEAEDLAKSNKEDLTIYKMTEVAKIFNQRTVKKINKKK